MRKIIKYTIINFLGLIVVITVISKLLNREAFNSVTILFVTFIFSLLIAIRNYKKDIRSKDE